jgi:hypothetical protein
MGIAHSFRVIFLDHADCRGGDACVHVAFLHHHAQKTRALARSTTSIDPRFRAVAEKSHPPTHLKRGLLF